ncbi:MAG: UbiX family flavin prenyltransferase [Syntrophothermus sp.]
MNRKIIVAVTGASGSVYAQLLLERLAEIKSQFETCAVIFSENGKEVWNYELGNQDYDKIPFTRYEPDDYFAPPASGSAGFTSMIVIPCSMGTLGRIASGVSTGLISRAADVMLKEKRQLILVPREMPFNLIHIRNMETLTLAGAVIVPASPSFYSKPASSREICMTVVDKVLDLAGLEFKKFQWGM